MKLCEIKGLGDARIGKLNKAGIFSPLDLCFCFPHRYIDATEVNRFDEVGEAVGYGRAIKIESKHIRKNLSYVKVEFVTGGGNNVGCNSGNGNNNSNNNGSGSGSSVGSSVGGNSGGSFFATWFNQPYISRAIKIGESYFVIGTLKKIGEKVDLSAPTLRKAEKGGGIISIYRAVGLSSGLFSEAVRCVLDNVRIREVLPAAVRAEFGLLDTSAALQKAHFPTSLEEAKQARRSLSLEVLSLQIALFQRAKSQGIKPQKYDKNMAEITLKLPFELTNDQKKAYNHIIEQLLQPNPANILVEGDVGSGKTAVSLLAMDFAKKSGHQSVLMSPTELLARQHYAVACRLFSPKEVELLHGSLTVEERKIAAENIKTGRARIIIGTHSVFSEGIEYPDLSLVITDEQQRFGVGQRAALENKAAAPDRIVMSATPIPRTLALTFYGDLQLVTLREKPRTSRVKTRFVGEKTAEMYAYIAGKAGAGEQTFIVCPRIDSDETDDCLTGAIELFKTLKDKLPEVGLLHGRMKDAEKTRAMNDFASGKTKILVSTTIVEVGIDIPAATTMAICNAERYGLSQLHQLRGRICRGGQEGYCFLLCTSGAERLRILESVSDGFALAEQDFADRGAGDFLGTRQHGDSVTLTGEPITAELLKQAKEIAEGLGDCDLEGLQLNQLTRLALN